MPYRQERRPAHSSFASARNDKPKLYSQGPPPTPRQRALAAKVAGQMRRGKTWGAALRSVGTTARTARKGGGSLFYRDNRRRIQARGSDRKHFRLNVLTEHGYSKAIARSSKERRV